MARTGCDVDARLLSYAWGIEHAKEAAALAVAAAAKAAAERSAARPIPAAAPPAGPASPTASNGTPQPFGSPVVTAMRTTSSNEPPAMPLEGKPPGATGSSRLAAAPVAPAARQGAARLRSLLPSGSSWLPFAVGVAAGTAGCWLALSRTRSS